MNEGIHPNLLENLANGWRLLRLSVEAPQRISSWDWIVLTAANESQTRIYEHQVEEARRRGLIPDTTNVLCVPDPDGQRIGSGGATLNALRAVAATAHSNPLEESILLIHAGGDSKRLPWASVPGKLFVPFPLQADHDHAVPRLFDHLLALTAPLVAQPHKKGVLLSLAGDVLPLFDAGELTLPENAAAVVTTAASLDLAERHGVIVAAEDARVQQLLQKPSIHDMLASGALVQGGAAKIDTGIYIFTGQSFASLFALANDVSTGLLQQLIKAGAECSLYEEIAWSMVPVHHEQLRNTTIGNAILHHMRHICLEHQDLHNFSFLHLGATPEYLAHLGQHWYGQLPRQILTETGTGVSPFSHAYSAQIPEGAQTGNSTAVVHSSLTPGVRIGNRCIVADFQADDEPLRLPDNCCLWQVPVKLADNIPRLVTLCCGVDDNPKDEVTQGTFGNQGFRQWMQRHGVTDSDLWDADQPKTLWNARLFPALKKNSGLAALRWTLGRQSDRNIPEQWRQNQRLSMADLQANLDLDQLFRRRDHLRIRLVLHALRAAVTGQAERNIAGLAAQLPTPEVQDRAVSLVPETPVSTTAAADVPHSRQWQIRADLYNAGAHTDLVRLHREKAFAAVSSEVEEALPVLSCSPVSNLSPDRTECVELPVRFDLAGGWSDTPPYCLEHPAAVLNFAMTLNGKKPVRVEARALDRPEWHLQLGDSGEETVITSLSQADMTADLNDPFVLLKTALILTGYGSEKGISQGIRICSEADVPRGSGLGTSSVLAAAGISALQRLAGRNDDTETVSELVLNLEQRMTTGGGWQDQIGGLVPGIKFISSIPTRPLRLRIDPVPVLPAAAEEFQQRFVVAFSGQERLAKNVLQIVVGRYLQRNSRMLEAVEGLVSLAGDARKLLSMGRLDELGRLLREVWALHQQLDPHCSNPAVDDIFRSVDDLACGYKLSGAGGGGFMGILAKDKEAADRITDRLSSYGHGLKVYDWQLA